MKKQSSKDVTASAVIEGEKSLLTVTMAYDESVSEVKGTVVSNDNRTYNVILNRTAPNVYVGSMDTVAEGGYILNLQITNTKGETDSVNTGFAIAYPKEYDRRNWGKGDILLNRIAEATGGRVLTSGEDVFTQKPQAVSESKSLTNLFLVLALIVFLLDVFFRRFYIVTQKLESILKGLKKEKNQTVPQQTVQNKNFEREMKQAQKRQQKKEKNQKEQQQNSESMATQLAQAKKKRKR